MKKTSSFLKALAESRARAAGEVVRLKTQAQRSAELLATAEADLALIDARIRKVESRIDPNNIEAIKAHKLYKGSPRGTLKNLIASIIKAQAPNAVNTADICDEIQARFQLEFLTPVDRMHWKANSVGRRLRVMAKNGLIERLHSGTNEEAGRWRWKSETSLSSDHLSEQLAATGAEVHQYDDSHE